MEKTFPFVVNIAVHQYSQVVVKAKDPEEAVEIISEVYSDRFDELPKVTDIDHDIDCAGLATEDDIKALHVIERAVDKVIETGVKTV